MLKVEEILKEFDISGDPEKLTIEEVRTARDTKFIGRAVVMEDDEFIKKATGKVTGSIQTALNRGFKDLEIEFAPEEIKGKKIEEVIALGIEKAKNSFSEIKEKSKAGNDVKLTAAEKKADEYKLRAKENEDALNATKGQLEQKEKEFSNQLKTFKLNHRLSEIKGKIPYSDTADDFKKKGFDMVFSENYKVDLDEKDEIILTDAEGKRIPTASKAGFYGFEDVYKQELEKAGMLKKNGQTTEKKVFTGLNGGANGNGGSPAKDAPQLSDKFQQHLAAMTGNS